MKAKIAIIGKGNIGWAIKQLLKDDYEITVFEKNDYVGGHTNTIDVHDGEKECSMDTGFMVFNEKTYPNLVKLFKKVFDNKNLSFVMIETYNFLPFEFYSKGGTFLRTNVS